MQQGMLKKPDSGVMLANSGSQGVSSSAWLPIKNDPAGNGEVVVERHSSGGERVVVRKGVSAPHNAHDLRARRSRPYPEYPYEGTVY
jgi:hypothetical protein